MISKTTKFTMEGHQDAAFASLVNFAAIVPIFVYEIGFGLLTSLSLAERDMARNPSVLNLLSS